MRGGGEFKWFKPEGSFLLNLNLSLLLGSETVTFSGTEGVAWHWRPVHAVLSFKPSRKRGTRTVSFS